MILGVGDGTFAVLFATAVAILIAIVGAYFAPDATLFILIGCLALPLIVFGCILSAPKASSGPPAGGSTSNSSSPYYYPYREQPFSPDTALIDTFLPVRIVVFLVLFLGLLAGIGFCVLDVAAEPPFAVPRMRCLREQLEEAHPSWYR